MIEHGYGYLAKQPLFKVNKGTKSIYIKDEKELENFINPIMQKIVQEGGGETMPEFSSTNEEPPPDTTTNEVPIEEID